MAVEPDSAGKSLLAAGDCSLCMTAQAFRLGLSRETRHSSTWGLALSLHHAGARCEAATVAVRRL